MLNHFWYILSRRYVILRVLITFKFVNQVIQGKTVGPFFLDTVYDHDNCTHKLTALMRTGIQGLGRPIETEYRASGSGLWLSFGLGSLEAPVSMRIRFIRMFT